MNRRFMQWLVAPAVVAGLASTGLVAGAASAGASAPQAKLKSATLNGSGSTFQQAYDQAAIQEFTTKNSGITINYAGGGSGKGRQDFSDQVVDFAGTDAAYPAADAAKVKGGDFFYIPMVVAPITVSYNLPDVKNLQLSASTIAKIFQRTITTWDDPAIKADNPKVTNFPSTKITVAHRSDSSGTTNNFTTFLTKAAPADWKLGANSTISWPSDTQGGNGNAGVASIVKSTEGGIGYVDYSDAKATGLTFAAVKNQALKFVKPTVKSASVAASTAAIPENLLYDPIYAPGAGAYPITSPTWILAYKTQSDAAKGAALKAFLAYMLSSAGQKLAKTVDFAPLPKPLVKAAMADVKQIGA